MNTTISIIVAVIYMIASLTAITLLIITVSRQKCLIKNLRRKIKVKRRRLVYWQDRAIQAEEELKKLKEEKQVQ